jgi:hypothetical protein
MMSNCSSGDGSALGPNAILSMVPADHYVAPTTNDYRLKPSSPALGTGINVLGFVPRDYDGDPRTAPMARGAYEGFFSSPMLPAAPSARSMTLAKIVAITRADGYVVRVGSNSEPVAYDGQAFETAGGANLSARRSEAGLKPTTTEGLGAITTDQITAEDLAAGLYDGAKVEVFTIDPEFPFATARKKDVSRSGKISHNDAA